MSTDMNAAGDLFDKNDVIPIPRGLRLELFVKDPDAVSSLLQADEGPERDELAEQALKIGLLALRQARGQIDADAVKREGDRMMAQLQSELKTHSARVSDTMATSLKEYFDPESGRFQERVERLVRKDGDLEQLLGKALGEDSQLGKTMASFVGDGSPLMRMLDPGQSEGVLAKIRGTVEQQLQAQQKTVLGEFSLDNEKGALSRLVKELSANHGQLSEKLRDKVDEVVKEFSLDEEDSALSRLVRNVDRAQRTITSQFSLDDDDSALARLKRELAGILEKQEVKNQKFQEEVSGALKAMTARKEESERSTRHGHVFEEAVCLFVQDDGQTQGDIVVPTGATTGRIKNCKVGDCVLELGPDKAAAGAKIVIEAKEDAKYNLKKAIDEIEVARKNRDAHIGIFVFSTKTAPDGLEPLKRFGDDIVIVWDAEDPASDLRFECALTLARALSVRIERNREELAEVDVEAIDRALLEIEKRLTAYDEITKFAETICSNGDKIKERARISRKAVEKELETLKSEASDLKAAVGDSR